MILDKLLKFQKTMDIRFNDIEILKKSLIHKSFDNKVNNEKLEFLGDRVIGLVLFKNLP